MGWRFKYKVDDVQKVCILKLNFTQSEITYTIIEVTDGIFFGDIVVNMPALLM